MALRYTEKVWRALYCNTDGVTYSREYFGDHFSKHFGSRAEVLAELLNENKSSNVLVVGCGFGFLIETLLDEGWNNVWGIEPSDYIWDNAGQQSRPDVISRMRQSAVEDYNHEFLGLPGRFDVVVDEDAACAMEDTELEDFYVSCNSLADRVIHFVTPVVRNSDSGLNWKSASEWKATSPDDDWVVTGSNEVLS